MGAEGLRGRFRHVGLISGRRGAIFVHLLPVYFCSAYSAIAGFSHYREPLSRRCEAKKRYKETDYDPLRHDIAR